MQKIVVASGNPHKIRELAAMLAEAPQPVEVVGLAGYPDAPVVAETAETFAGNAALKARGIADFLAGRGEPGDTAVLADDSGVCVEAFGGAPGVRSARFAGEDASDADNNAKLVAELQALGRTSSPAYYACVLALCRVDGGPLQGDPMRHFEGRWDVQVRVEARGMGGFGYDPYAWVDDGARTVAELTGAQKAARSHRGAALRALLAGWPLGEG